MKRELDNWLQSYIKYTTYTEAPMKMHFWTGVSVIASALRRKVWLDMGYWNWYPNFYIILVAPPGIVGKSTTLAIGQSLLTEVEGIHFGPSSTTWQGLIKRMSEVGEQIPMGDAYYPMSCLSVFAGELGTFFDPGDSASVDILTDLWDGKEGAWEKITRGAGDDLVENPWINIISATTPAWIADHFTESTIGGGLASRIIFIFARKKRHLVPYPHLVVNGSDRDLRAKLIRDLQQIAAMAGNFTLTKGALAWGEEWYEHHWTSRPSHLTSERFSGYIARKQTHLHKLAIVLSAARGNEMVITEQDLIQCNAMLLAVEKEMLGVFTEIGKTTSTRHMAELLVLIKASGTVEKSALYRMVFHQMASRDFEDAVTACIRAGYVSTSQRGNQTFLTHTKQGQDDQHQEHRA